MNSHAQWHVDGRIGVRHQDLNFVIKFHCWINRGTAMCDELIMNKNNYGYSSI